MYVKVEDGGVISKRCDDRDAEELMKHAPAVVLHTTLMSLEISVVASTSARWSRVLLFSKMT